MALSGLTYNISITYQSSQITGMTQSPPGATAAFITGWMPMYSGGTYLASMPATGLTAAGSSYTAALTALLALTASTATDGTISPTRYW